MRTIINNKQTIKGKTTQEKFEWKPQKKHKYEEMMNKNTQPNFLGDWCSFVSVVVWWYLLEFCPSFGGGGVEEEKKHKNQRKNSVKGLDDRKERGGNKKINSDTKRDRWESREEER